MSSVLRWESIKENKKVRKKEKRKKSRTRPRKWSRKKESFSFFLGRYLSRVFLSCFLDRFLVWVLVFLFSWSLSWSTSCFLVFVLSLINSHLCMYVFSSNFRRTRTGVLWPWCWTDSSSGSSGSPPLSGPWWSSRSRLPSSRRRTPSTLRSPRLRVRRPEFSPRSLSFKLIFVIKATGWSGIIVYFSEDCQYSAFLPG